jgi:hypothetical protein
MRGEGGQVMQKVVHLSGLSTLPLFFYFAHAPSLFFGSSVSIKFVHPLLAEIHFFQLLLYLKIEVVVIAMLTAAVFKVVLTAMMFKNTGSSGSIACLTTYLLEPTCFLS